MSLIRNRGIEKHYEIIDKYEAGLVLKGAEVKSLRKAHASLSGSYVSIDNNEMYIVGMKISRWSHTTSEVDEIRKRKLLLKNQEINRIQSKIKQKGYTVIPISVYQSGKHLKMEIALAKGLKKYDVKAKEKEMEKEMKKEAKQAKATYL